MQFTAYGLLEEIEGKTNTKSYKLLKSLRNNNKLKFDVLENFAL